MAKRSNPHIQFATIYSSQASRTLTVSYAMGRLLQLQEEIRDLRERDGGGNSLEAHAYYPIGCVTCLEWHARSRLVDLLSFRPEAISEKDFKEIGTQTLAQAITQNVSIAHLMGSMASVSSAGHYIQIFQRVFDVLGVKESAGSILEASVEKREGQISVTERDLYEFRNHIVHEIDRTIAGPFSLREFVTLDKAAAFCELTERIIEGIEARISRHAPDGFPNKIGDDGAPQDEFAHLGREIKRLEGDIHFALVKWDADVLAAWKKAVTAYKVEEEFIDKADFLAPVSHVDSRRGVKIALRKQRVAYLRLIWDEMRDLRKAS